MRVYLALSTLLAFAPRRTTAASCLELGFTDTLACTQCAKMAEFVSDAELLKECRGCCTEDSAADVTYVTAKLEVCE